MAGGRVKGKLLFSITKKDFKLEYFSGSGAGGQYRNKHQNCVRLYHPGSGVRVTGQSNRNRIANLREAFHNLVSHPTFRLWLNRRINEVVTKETIKEKVEKLIIQTENLKIEYKVKNKWEEV